MNGSFYKGALLEAYRDINAYGFSCHWQIKGKLYGYIARPIYISQKEALQEAKKFYMLSNVRNQIRSVAIAYDLETKTILAQSYGSEDLFGEIEIEGFQIDYLYPLPQDRSKILPFVLACGRYRVASQELRLFDGKKIEAAISFELINVDQSTQFIVERIES